MRKLLSSFGVKLAFVSMYVFSNIWAAIDIEDRHALIGDHAGWPAPSSSQILGALTLVLVVYCGLLFIIKEKKQYPLRMPQVMGGTALSVSILALQGIFFLFVLVSGAGAAGADLDKAGGGLRFLFYLVNPDMLFVIYYAATMDSPERVRLRNVNLLIFFASNLVRGWIGQTLVIVFLFAIQWVQTSGRHLSFGKLVKMTLALFVFFVFASVLMYVKVAFRLGGGAIVSLLSNVDVLDIFAAFFETLFSRLQLLSTVLFQITKQLELSRFIENGTLGSFYTDGLPQQTVYKILGLNPGENLNLFLWKYYIPGDFFEVQTTVQPGLVGWLYLLSPTSLLFFGVYIFSLIFLTLRLVRRFGGNGLRHLTWFSVMLYLVPGWLGAYISFIWSLLIFSLLVSLLKDRSAVSASVKAIRAQVQR